MTRKNTRSLTPPTGRAPATKASIERAEATLGVRLPKALHDLLLASNGGIPSHACLPSEPNSWATDHVRVSSFLGIGHREGMDGELGSAYLIREWGYPKIGVVLADTPSAGEDVIMLDYRLCGTSGEPSVVFVEHDRRIIQLASSFAKFWEQLRHC
ncbi:MAG: SMI1/KNR4 family protein [Archangium sp.]|nr:SMI1/KNR4 family protein [Archangium sp.]